MSDAENSLRKLICDIAEKRKIQRPDIKIKGFNSGGANYTSAVYFITISSPSTEKLNLFAKIASMGEKIRNRPHINRLYTAEQIFYNKVVNKWDRIQKKFCMPDENKFIFPEFYGGSPKYGEETIVLENLSEKGYITYNRFKSIDWEYASNAVETMAKFHAFSFVHEKEFPDEYKSLAEELEYGEAIKDGSDQQVWNKMVESSIQVLTKDHKDKLVKFLDKMDKKAFNHFYNPIDKPMLVHGDYRPSNLMYKKQNDSMQIIPIDFQTVRTGSPVSDLIYFIFMGSDKEFRANHYKQIIEHYYEKLSLALSRFKIDINEVYPRETFENDYKLMRQYVPLLGLFLLPVFTVEEDNAPRVDGDSDFETFIVKPNELYKQRFNDLIEDCIRYNII